MCASCSGVSVDSGGGSISCARAGVQCVWWGRDVRPRRRPSRRCRAPKDVSFSPVATIVARFVVAFLCDDLTPMFERCTHMRALCDRWRALFATRAWRRWSWRWPATRAATRVATTREAATTMCGRRCVFYHHNNDSHRVFRCLCARFGVQCGSR